MAEEISFHTDYQLPRVSPETGASLLADAQESGYRETMKLAEERLSTNNPDLYLAIGQFAHGMGLQSAEAIKAAHGAMIMTHELLRRQAETDSLSTHFDAPDAQ